MACFSGFRKWQQRNEPKQETVLCIIDYKVQTYLCQVTDRFSSDWKSHQFSKDPERPNKFCINTIGKSRTACMNDLCICLVWSWRLCCNIYIWRWISMMVGEICVTVASQTKSKWNEMKVTWKQTVVGCEGGRLNCFGGIYKKTVYFYI